MNLPLMMLDGTTVNHPTEGSEHGTNIGKVASMGQMRFNQRSGLAGTNDVLSQD